MDVEVPCLDGTWRRTVNFDNAASTSALRSVRSSTDRFLDYCASVHRGTGCQSRVSTQVYEAARHRALRFVGAHPDMHVDVFGKNTSEGINKLARRLLAAAILGYESGIGVRGGCFCVHPYALRLVGIGESQAADMRARMLAGDRRQMPGMVRVSVGLYNTKDEIDWLVEASLGSPLAT